MTNTTFSNGPAVRAAVRIKDGLLLAAPFDAEDIQTESAFSFGDVAGMDIEGMFDHIKWVFKVEAISG